MDFKDQNTKNTVGKIVSFVVVAFIIFLVGYLVISSNDTKLNEEMHSTAIQDLEENGENNQNNEILGIDDKIDEDEQDSIKENTTDLSISRKIIVYKDKNHNQSQDDDEDVCDICVGKYINAVSLSGGTVYPSNENFLEIPIQGGGLINEDKINTTNHIWGFFDDREVIIPHTDIFLGDGVEDLYLPAWEYTVAISGANTTMQKGELLNSTNGHYEVSYVFNDLLPILNEQYKGEKEVYIYFIPDRSKLGTGYLVKGKIQKKVEEYSLDIIWPFNSMFDDVLKPENLTVVVL